MVLVDRSYVQTDILHAVQVTYQKKRLRDTLKIRDNQTACEEALFPLYFMNTGFTIIPPWTITLIPVNTKHSILFPAGLRIFRMTLLQESSGD